MSYYFYWFKLFFAYNSMRGSKGVGGPGPHPLKNHKFIFFPGNAGMDPPKLTKLSSQHSMCALIDPPVKHHLNGVSRACR